jgi:hypothetical protein
MSDSTTTGAPAAGDGDLAEVRELNNEEGSAMSMIHRPTPHATGVSRPRPAAPLFRTTFTVAHPEDGDIVSVQVIVLADGVEEGTFAGESDLPELREAGWIRHSLNDFTVCLRTLS